MASPATSGNRVRRPRRDPLSCQTCRIKKLKCNRQRPCSNCQSRRLHCVYSREPLPDFESTPGTTTTTTVTSGGSPPVNNDQIQARLERLEQAVFGIRSTVTSQKNCFNELSPAVGLVEQDDEGGDVELQSAWLHIVGTRPADALPHFSDKIQVSMHNVDQLASHAEHLSELKSIQVPSEETAMEFLLAYELRLGAVHSIMHIPDIRRRIKAFYTDLRAQKTVELGLLSLLLAICASVGFWHASSRSTSTSQAAQERASTVLTKQCLLAVEHARISSQISVETVQATILLEFHFCQLEGFTPRTRLLHSSAVTIARELGLHRIDAAARSSICDLSTEAEIEIGRRVWWHLTCTDWLFAYMGGPQEGIYSISPRHIAVSKPRNLREDDISSISPTFCRPETEPTIMSFYLQRMKLATTCREVMDTLGDLGGIIEPDKLLQSRALELDGKFRTIIDSLPYFLSFNTSSQSLKIEFGDLYDRQIAPQRALFNLMVHQRRCKLHVPCLMRFKSDPEYSTSRELCLQSARAVLQVGYAFHLEDPSKALARYLRLGAVLHHVFYATVVLIVDSCVNGRNEAQLAEIHKAMKLVEEASRFSKIASTFMQSLTALLRKDDQQAAPIRANDNNAVTIHDRSVPSNPSVYNDGISLESKTDGLDPQSSFEDYLLTDDSGFDGMWQQLLDNGAGMDLESWDILLNDIEMHTV